MKFMKKKRVLQHLRSTAIAGAFLLIQGVPSRAITVTPRIMTPNGDSWNDKVVFQVENDAFLPLSGEVFDLRGAKVSDLAPGDDPFTILEWDGRRSGSLVPGGIYIYQISVGNKILKGTVVVAQ
jgi:hypothetical protein